MSRTPKELARRYLETVAEGNVEECLACFAPDAVIRMATVPPEGQLPRGRDAFAPTFRMIFNRFEKFTWPQLDVYSTDDEELAVIRAKSEAKLKNGRDYSNDYCMFIRARNGEIVESTEFFDPVRGAAVFSD